ncbi:hypothetical protein GGD92_02385 [Pseudomonas protegens]|uniref:Lipoprotein n=1 Tax=Pseudomonas protegens TaxID=380021 RepID=A0A7G8YVZ0_9PSED|nr:hypothetical protein [Pseudomonas protegens]QNH80821.1 hypothetical protein GGI48_28520 [Pseudomonas protegens]QNL09034.1 hypothetical protein GGD92_02385 [Pseudomonas protegens]
MVNLLKKCITSVVACIWIFMASCGMSPSIRPSEPQDHNASLIQKAVMLMEEAGEIARLIDTMPRLPALVRSVDLSARARVLLRHPERGSLRADSQAPWKPIE